MGQHVSGIQDQISSIEGNVAQNQKLIKMNEQLTKTHIRNAVEAKIEDLEQIIRS